MWANIVENYNTIINDYSDPRVKNWFLMSSPFPTLIMCFLYVLTVKKIGPWLMRDRKPFELRKILIVYNFFQVLFSSWIFYEALDCGWGNTYSLGYERLDKSITPLTMRIARACWWYYFSKFTKFFDTFFFVMRKKDHQVSTLHVIHHGIMPMSVWIGVKFSHGGHGTFFGLLNTFVHIVMYSYYMLAAIGPQMQKYLWWKKHLTLLQMVQFTLVFVHSARLLTLKDCDQIKLFTWLIMLHAAMFFCLFFNFYRHSYKKRAVEQQRAGRQKKKKKDDDGDGGTTADGEQNKSFWFAGLSAAPCCLPAVTDGRSRGRPRAFRRGLPAAAADRRLGAGARVRVRRVRGAPRQGVRQQQPRAGRPGDRARTPRRVLSIATAVGRGVAVSAAASPALCVPAGG